MERPGYRSRMADPEGMELTISEKDQKWGGIKELKK